MRHKAKLSLPAPSTPSEEECSHGRGRERTHRELQGRSTPVKWPEVLGIAVISCHSSAKECTKI